MIEQFSVKNYLSFKEKEIISFLATSDKHLLEELIHEPKPGVKILKLILIYGANASGKTNLLVAIESLWMLLISPYFKDTNSISLYRPFVLNKEEPVEFEIVFWRDDKKYRYFVSFDENMIIEERFEYTSSSGVMSMLYYRFKNDFIKFGSTLDFKAKTKNDIALNTLKNHTVLSTLSKINVDGAEVLKDIYNWIKSKVHETHSHDNISEIIKYANKNQDIKSYFLKILSKADFNIVDFKTIESKLDEDFVNKINNDDSVSFEVRKELLKPRLQVLIKHINENNEEFLIDYGMESSGTRAYFRLARVLLEFKECNCVILEDELEDSLHYDLLLHFLETFLRQDNGNQLIFTTHNQMLLDEDWMIRRDMIFFIEKEKSSSSSIIYRASDLGLHKNLSLLNAYKSGKLGAKPLLGSTII